MPQSQEFFRGEHTRTLDERHRFSVPSEWVERLGDESGKCVMAKERPGCLSLWNAAQWEAKLEARAELIEQKFRLGQLDQRIGQVQMFGRLWSTRQRPVEFRSGGRLLVPDGFREFLGVEPGGGLMVIGAAVCVEVWNPKAWVKYLEGRMSKFRRLFDHLSK
jgi:MraZ protein